MLVGLLLMGIIIRLVQKRLRESVNALHAVSESGNLARCLDIDGSDEVSELAVYFNRFVEKIKGVVDLVIASSTSLAAESQRMNEATCRSQKQVAQQQHDTAEIANAIEHVAASAEQVKTNADAAAEAAASADTHTREGQVVVEEVIGAIQALAGEVSDAAGVITRVENGSEQIGMVLSVIRSISEQTNLLALNAAIEAVVADEVRSLSEKIHSETDQIQEIIDQLQQSSREAAEVMGRSTERSSAVAGKAQSAGSALAGIASSVSTINEMNRSIADLSGDQLARVEEVRNKIVSIRGIAEEAASTASQAATSSNEFTIMAGQLQDLVRQFLQEEDKEAEAADDIEMF